MLISDCHTDFITAFSVNKSFEYFNELSNGSIINLALFTDDLFYFDIKKILTLYKFYQKKYKNIKFLKSIENISSLKKEEIINLNPFCVSLTWNYDNEYAGGALEDGSLTKKGIEAVKYFDSENILIDAAHLNRKSFFELNKIYQIKFNSHTAFFDLKKHKRNIDDQQIKIIIENNGIIALTLVNKFLSDYNYKKNDVNTIRENLDFFISKYGYNNLSVGTDFGGTFDLPLDINTYKDFYILKEHLLQKGFSDEIINAIFYENFNEFLKRNNLKI